MNADNKNKVITTDSDFKRSGSNKANQLGPSSPFEGSSSHPQADAAASSADNDMDRQTNMEHNQQEDAEEAQSDGNLSFPEGK